MTVAHKNLTGTDLHEVKGASTATAGQVPVADGAGGAPFGKLTHTSLGTTGNPFGAQLFYAHETQAAGVVSSDAGTLSSFVTTPLNTVANNDIGGSLASNTITLPAGTYWCEIDVPWQAASSGAIQTFTTRLFNLTTVLPLLVGKTVKLFGASNNATLSSTIRGRFTLVTSSVLSVQHYKTAGVIGSQNTVQNELYTEARFWKVA